MRRTLSRLLLVVAGLGVGFAIVELAVRAAEAPVDATDLRSIHELQPDADWLYRMRPGAIASPESGPRYAINARGFRDRERSLSKPPGSFRILVVGDSVTFGFGVELEETYPSLLESRLRESLPGIEVLNLGVGGYNPYTESALLRGVGLAYEPDLVLVQFCINDLADPTIHFDNHARTRLGTLPDAAFPNPGMRTHDTGGRSLVERVCFASKLCLRGYDWWLARTQAKIDAPTRHLGALPIEHTEGPEWKWLAARYREMADAARKAGADFGLLLFPHRRLLLRPADAGPDPVQSRLERLAREEGWPVVDLLPHFLDAQRGGDVFLDYWHPSPRGHAATVVAIESELGCAGLLGGIRSSECPGALQPEH
ncbi:MAG: SGNH/GDSL hydrolase family protein [Myxococcota bacterium]|nr:SGNH/GDSL hydrolase family protein [Myxococcota bacterium]